MSLYQSPGSLDFSVHTVILSLFSYCRIAVLLTRCSQDLSLVLVPWWKIIYSWNATLLGRLIIRGCPVRPHVFPTLLHSSLSWINVPTSQTSTTWLRLFTFLLLRHFLNFSCWHSEVPTFELTPLLCLQVYDLLWAYVPVGDYMNVCHADQQTARVVAVSLPFLGSGIGRYKYGYRLLLLCGFAFLFFLAGQICYQSEFVKRIGTNGCVNFFNDLEWFYSDCGNR